MCMAAGIASPLFPGAVLAFAAQSKENTYPHDSFETITPSILESAATVAGISLTKEQIAMVLDGVTEQRKTLRAIRSLKMPSSIAPAMVFDPRPQKFTMPHLPAQASQVPIEDISVEGLAGNENRLAFASITQLAHLLRTRKVTSTQLTKMYLARLRRFDPKLHFVVTLTEERALKQAAQADAEIAAGRYRGLLHGIPWGAKDLLNVAGYSTTWGAAGMEKQAFDDDATVVKRLDDAGAVLVAKLSMGALAMGDVWFGGKTRNPWNPKQGSSGSSAGSASAVSAGCVAFAIGSETLGSISSPSSRCGVSGFRPSYGLVPKTGAMPLSWSMDKLGPICRSVEDCALVLNAIQGADGIDHAVRNDVSFRWSPTIDWKTLRIGYNASRFEVAGPDDLSPKPKAPAAMKGWLGEKAVFDTKRYDNRYDRATLEALKQMGVTLIPIKMPDLPWSSISVVLEAEAAASFDELTRSGRDSLLTGQSKDDWPNMFRAARFLTAVDYIQAQRARSIGIEAVHKIFEEVDVIVTPTGGTQSRITNLTGQPSITVPNGVRGKDAPVPAISDDGADENYGGPGTMTSITFLGGLYNDARLAAFARAYQEHTGFHKLHPPLFS